MPIALAVVIDDQLELCQLLDRQVGRLFAFENAAGIDAGQFNGILNAARSS